MVMRKFLVSVALCGVVMSAASAADLRSLDASGDETAPNQFTLDFGDGTPRSAQITDTYYDLQIDATTGTARFTRYEQFIDPIEIPIGPGVFLSTGELTVRIVPGTSTGNYVPGTGVFSTSEQYEISFTGDLSALGFFSPVILPSTSTGQIVFDTPSDGRIGQTWEGDVMVGPIPLGYQCQVNTIFSQRLVGDLNCDGQVSTSDINSFVTAITNPSAYAATHPTCDIHLADFNGDGRVTVGDISLFVDTLAD
jgi:hypothetical protein